MKTLYLHIGFPKTGTTTFYEHIVPNLKGVSVFAPNTSQKILKMRLSKQEFAQSLVLKECLETFLYRESGHDEAIRILQSVPHEKVFLTSVNLMAGQFFEGLYIDKGGYIDARLIAQRIYEVFSGHFNVEILISVRAQADWIHSAFVEWHNYLPKASGGGDFSKFIGACTTLGTPQRAALDYHSLGTIFEERFGAGSVAFAFYEELKMNPMSYFSGIAFWLGASLSDETVSLIPRANNRSVSVGNKRTDTDSLLLFLFGLKMKFFPNVRLNIENRAPFIVSLLKSLTFRRYKVINMSEETKILIQKEFSESNKLFIEKYSPKAELAQSYLHFAPNRSL